MTNVTLMAEKDADVTVLYNVGNENTTNSPVSEFDVSQYEAIEKYFWIIFCPIFLVIGTIGNVLNVFILRKLKFHKNATYTLLLILAFADMTVLFVGITRYWLLYLADVDLRVLSDFSCKFSLFLIYFSMQFSSWILVLVTVVRFMKTFVPLRQSKYKDITVKNTSIAVLVVGVLLMCINLHFFWTNGLVINDGTVECSSLNEQYYYFDEYVFVYVDLVFMSFLPALIMIALNAIICTELRKLTKTRRRMSLRRGSLNQNKQKSTKRVTWMLVVTTSYFIVATIPISIYFIVDTYMKSTADELTTSRLSLTWTFTYLFQFSHFALNFYLYTATNQKFRKELTKLTYNVYNRISTSSQNNKGPSRDYSSESKKLSATAST